MIKFSIPEINFACIYAGESKHETIDNIIYAIPHITEPDMISLAECVIDKIGMLTDEQYAEHNFTEQFTDDYERDYVEYAG
jgi:hypothetical protein